AATTQRFELPLAVTKQRLDAWHSARSRLAAIEMCYAPATALRVLGQVRADETGSAENQQGLRLRRISERAQRGRGTKQCRHLQQVTSSGHGIPRSVSAPGRQNGSCRAYPSASRLQVAEVAHSRPCWDCAGRMAPQRTYAAWEGKHHEVEQPRVASGSLRLRDRSVQGFRGIARRRPLR